MKKKNMIKVKIVWYEVDSEIHAIGKRRQKTYYFTYEKFKEVFDMIDRCEEPIWMEFDFFLLEEFYRDENVSYVSSTVYFNGLLPPRITDWTSIERKYFLQSIMRQARLDDIIPD